MPYTYIYLYIVVVGIIFPLVSLCAHTITHTSMTMMYSVRDTQYSAFRPTQKWPQNFRYVCLCYFRDKFVVFALNWKFASLICNIYHVIVHSLPKKHCF